MNATQTKEATEEKTTLEDLAHNLFEAYEDKNTKTVNVIINKIGVHLGLKEKELDAHQIGQGLKAIREKAGITQSEMAEQTGIWNQHYISVLENKRPGQRANIQTLEKYRQIVEFYRDMLPKNWQ